MNSSLSSAMAAALSRFRQAMPMKRPSWWKAPCQSPLITKINKPMEYSSKRLIKVPSVEVSGLFKDYDFHLVQSLDTLMEIMNALSLNYWLSKFLQDVTQDFLTRF